MFAKPQAEHEWLCRLVGEWTVESECQGQPGEPPMAITGHTSITSLGGLWIIMNGNSDTPDGEACQSVLTIGYDPEQKRYVGSFIASVMSNLWVYSGTFDAEKNKLTLDTTGPKFDMSGMAQYQDMVEIVDDNHWILSSQVQGDDGSWLPFMTAHHRRKTA